MIEYSVPDPAPALAALAVTICLCAAAIAHELARRGRAGSGALCWAWPLAAGLVAGSGVWTAQFLATLSWRPGTTVIEAPVLATLSILLGIVGAAACFSLATVSGPGGQAVSGALMGLVIAAMHHLGAAALWPRSMAYGPPGLVGSSLLLAGGFGALSFRLAADPRCLRRAGAAVALVLAAVTPHLGDVARLGSLPSALTGPPPVGGGAWMLMAAALFVTPVLLAAGSMGIWLDRQLVLLRARHAVLLEQHSRHLEAASRAQGRFVTNVSHEIMTPMNAVLGFADLLARSGLDMAQQRYVGIIRDTGRQLLTLLNDILDIARLEAGLLDLEQVDFPLSSVLEQVRSQHASQAARRGLLLAVETLVPADLVLRGDPVRLRQVLGNLVGNGLKFTSRGSVGLRVRTVEGDAGRLCFEITDTGIGIAAERQAELFRPFVQVDGSSTRPFGGTGLGLAICASLVRAMGGTIGLDSTPGRGSRFWLELPLERGDAVVAIAPATPTPARTRPLDILVADDVAINRELLGEILRRQEHRVRMAEDGALAVAAVAEQPPDVVLMDIQMPVMDGIEATRLIRRLPGPAGRVPILALTASLTAQDRECCLASGMNRCLTKPVAWPQLFAALAAVTDDRAGTAATPAATSLPPLLDRALLAGLARNLPPGNVGQLLARGLDGAADSCHRLLEARHDPQSLAGEAHRLRGTAGSFGLARLAALASVIEDRLRLQEPVGDLLDNLTAALAETRTEVADMQAERGANPAEIERHGRLGQQC